MTSLNTQSFALGPTMPSFAFTMNRATWSQRTSTRPFSESRDGNSTKNSRFRMTKQQDAINKRMRGGDQTAATKAEMAEAKVAN
jgi:hypothetical protein